MDADIAVVGLGLIGSAALRQLAAGGSSVVGIGPAEPENWSTHQGPFSSHYDSGRVTRRLDARYEWAELASRSIAQYPKLEERSGWKFHSPVGLLFVRNDEVGIGHQREVIERLDLPVAIGRTDDLESGYSFPNGYTVLSEPGPAGFIDPRIMLAAQLAVASQGGATIVRSWVASLERSGGGFRLECADGSEVTAGRVLVTTGPYLNDLLPVHLAARLMPEAVLLGRVSPVEAARLAALPSLIYLPSDPDFDDVYVVPPARYPDGHWYVKIGGSIPGAEPLDSPEEKRSWMAGSDADQQVGWLRRMLEALLPEAAFEGFVAKPCLITDTVHGLPYVDEVEEGLFVAVGGCGHAAKSSDAIGALAAGLVETHQWNDEALDQSAFRAVFGEYEESPTSRHGY